VSDLPKHLRGQNGGAWRFDAADEIERLSAENATLQRQRRDDGEEIARLKAALAERDAEISSLGGQPDPSGPYRS